jgi:hypothetical protein
MTVSAPSFIFPHTFNNSMAGEHGYHTYNSSGQTQLGHRAERPRLDTGSSAYGNCVRSLFLSSH